MKLCGFDAGLDHPLFVIAGPCVVESEDMTMRIATQLRKVTEELGMRLIFKASYDKANRSSGGSFRGLGMDFGLRVLEKVRHELGVPVITDVHSQDEIAAVAAVVDVIQTPAFLCRQTDFIQACARSGKPVNIKKGQFLAPWDMQNVAAKVASTGNQRILLCERGASFGYNTLVVDMRALPIMARTGYPVVFDATHAVATPGGLGDRSGGEREFGPVLARAAAAIGVAAIFLETHQDPDRAGTAEASTMLPLKALPELLETLIAFDRLAKARPAGAM
jgi:2-dehydro-3-deoxyphosphooctonate aldolase (KDO 8-P synthase)